MLTTSFGSGLDTVHSGFVRFNGFCLEFFVPKTTPKHIQLTINPIPVDSDGEEDIQIQEVALDGSSEDSSEDHFVV